MTTTDLAPAAVGIDIGGTKLVAATVAADGTILQRRRQRTPAGNGEQILTTIREVADALDPDGHLPLGIGIAAIVDRHGTVRYGPQVGARDFPLAELLHDQTGRHATIGNDATVATYGEYRAGAGRGTTNAVMLTIGTGIGGGIIYRGDIVHGSGGYAGELGHIIVDEAGRRCPCGNRGCVEAYASGTAIGLLARERLVDREITSTLRDVAQLDGKAVTMAAQSGDAFARDVLQEAGVWLGVAMASLANALDPELFIVGGGATTQAGEFMLPPARAALAERLLGRQHRQPPSTVEATLGDDAGMVGAALLAAAPEAASENLATTGMAEALKAHYEQHPHARPSLAETALALAAQDNSPVADHPDLVERAAAQIVDRRPNADADDVLLWAEAQLHAST